MPAFDAAFGLGELLVGVGQAVHQLVVLLPPSVVEGFEREELNWEPISECVCMGVCVYVCVYVMCGEERGVCVWRDESVMCGGEGCVCVSALCGNTCIWNHVAWVQG